MKKIAYLIIFSVFFALECAAQQPANMEPLSNKTTAKGRRELRRELRIHHAATKLASQNERRARKEHDLGTALHHDSKAKKLAKDRKKAKLKEEKAAAKKNKEEAAGDDKNKSIASEAPKG